jgi:hypothetical protein
VVVGVEEQRQGDGGDGDQCKEAAGDPQDDLEGTGHDQV